MLTSDCGAVRPRCSTGIFVSALVALLLVAGCGGGDAQGGSQEEESASPVAGTFVGEAPDAAAFVALVADVPEEEGDEREVKAYLCDGQTVSDWFWGSVVGNDLSLSSDSGAQMEGQITPDAATGTITDPNGDSVSFDAPLAAGIADLYDVSVSSDGALSGTSQTGGQMEGQLGNILEENDTYPVRGTITLPDGQPQDFSALTSPNTSDQHRWIILADGQIKGGNKGGGFEFGGFQKDLDGRAFKGPDGKAQEEREAAKRQSGANDGSSNTIQPEEAEVQEEREAAKRQSGANDGSSNTIQPEEVNGGVALDFDRGRGRVGGTVGQVVVNDGSSNTVQPEEAEVQEEREAAKRQSGANDGSSNTVQP